MGSRVSVHHCDSPSLGTDYTEVVTLVVGNDRECKAHIAQALAKASGATKDEFTEAGVRIFTKESSPSAPVVIDTTPLCTTKDWGRVDTARVWISRNGLRKLFGKHVFVVCVVASTDPNDEINKEPDFACNRFSWLHVLACILEKHIQQLVMLVNSEDSTDEASRRIPRLKEILKRDGYMGQDNITFFNLRTELTATIKSVLRHSDYRGEAEDETTTNRSVMPGPFFLRRVSWNQASDKDKFGPWGPENITLFGRTGSGKSTLAQMLTSGRLGAKRRKFETTGRRMSFPAHPILTSVRVDAKHRRLSISSTIRGEATRVNIGHIRGWCVISGLVESVDDEKSSVFTAKVREFIKTHLKLVEGKKARAKDLDVLLWMRACFERCESFVTSLGRRDTSTAVGMWSKGPERRNAKHCEHERITLRPSIRQSPAFGPSAGQHPHPCEPADYEPATPYIMLGRGCERMVVPWKKRGYEKSSVVALEVIN